ncbi:MAG: hypothetical protein IJO74_07125 [Clostridia bacterium]|nr:hypothetical protein [Clostridia bacterium]
MDNTLLRNKILDAVYNAREKYMYCVFGFSDESEQSLLHSIIHSTGFTDYMFWGGYTDAERKCLGIFPSVPETEYFPISFIKFTSDKFSSLTHRDYMGKLLNEGVKRDILGDILIIDKHSAYVAIYNQNNMADYLCNSVSKIGRATVRCQLMPEGFIPDITKAFEIISFTVSSLRLDSVVAGAIHSSRTTALKLIHDGAVTLNHVQCTKPDCIMKCGDVFSVHRKGKFVLQENGGLTKKDKTRVNIKKYI